MTSHTALLPLVVQAISDSGDYTLNGVHRALESARGRRITIRSQPFDRGVAVCAVWFAYEDQDVVIHAETPSMLHRQQIVLHEFAHIMLEHGGAPNAAQRAANLFPSLPASEVKAALRFRSNFSDPEEIAAERLADRFSLLLLRGPRVSGHVLRKIIEGR